MGRGRTHLNHHEKAGPEVDRIHQPQEQPSFARTAYENAAQDCRDIAAQAGVRNCEDNPDWRAAEYEAEQMYAAIPRPHPQG